jgi:hypothetical protein
VRLRLTVDRRMRAVWDGYDEEHEEG